MKRNGQVGSARNDTFVSRRSSSIATILAMERVCPSSLCRDGVIARNGDWRFGFGFIRAEEGPAATEHVLKPGAGELRGDHGGKHQSGIEGGVDDSRVKGHAGEHDARTAARIGSERKVDQVKAVESSEATSHGYRDDFDDTGANKEEQQKLPGERFHEIKLEADNGEIHRDEKRKGDFADGVQRVSKEAALLVDDGEGSEERREHQINVECASKNTVCEQYSQRVTDGRLPGEKVVFRFVDSFHGSGQ